MNTIERLKKIILFLLSVFGILLLLIFFAALLRTYLGISLFAGQMLIIMGTGVAISMIFPKFFKFANRQNVDAIKKALNKKEVQHEKH